MDIYYYTGLAGEEQVNGFEAITILKRNRLHLQLISGNGLFENRGKLIRNFRENRVGIIVAL